MNKDGGRKEPDMKLQWLKDILGDSYTEEQDAKVCAALGGAVRGPDRLQ